MSLMRRLSLAAVLVATVGVAACAEDLTAVNATWATTSEAWNKAVAEARKANDELAAKLTALPAVADADAAGKDLKKKADDALAAHKQAVSDVEQLTAETKTAVEKAQAEKKIAPVQAAIDAGVAKSAALVGKIGEAATAAAAAVDGLKAHLDAEAAKAAAAAADPAAKDPETVKTQNGEASLTFVFTDKNAVDEAASAAGIDRLTKLLGSCDALKVELTGTGADEKAGKAHADSLQKLVEGKGLKGKIVKTSGAMGDGATKLVVTTPCT